jgi:hypothetical protein
MGNLASCRNGGGGNARKGESLESSWVKKVNKLFKHRELLWIGSWSSMSATSY